MRRASPLFSLTLVPGKGVQAEGKADLQGAGGTGCLRHPPRRTLPVYARTIYRQSQRCYRRETDRHQPQAQRPAVPRVRHWGEGESRARQAEDAAPGRLHPVLLQFHHISFMSIISRCGARDSNQLQTASPAGRCRLDSSFVLNAVVSPDGITMNRQRYCPEEFSGCLKETLRERVTRPLCGLANQVDAPATAVGHCVLPETGGFAPSGHRPAGRHRRHETSDSVVEPRACVLPALTCTGFLRMPEFGLKQMLAESWTPLGLLCSVEPFAHCTGVSGRAGGAGGSRGAVCSWQGTLSNTSGGERMSSYALRAGGM